MWLYVLLAILLYIVYSKMVKASQYWKKRSIPYIPAKPKLSVIIGLLKSKYDVIESTNFLYNEYPQSRYNGIFIILTPVLLLRDPELIKQITVKDFDHFMDHTNLVSNELDPILSRNLTALTGQKWRDMRSTLSPSFTGSKMKFMFSLVSDCAQQFTSYFENQTLSELAEIDMKDAFSRFSNDVIATTAFGVQIDSLVDKYNEFFMMGKDASSIAGTRLLRLWGYVLFPSVMKFFKVSIFPKKFNEFFRKIIRETIAQRRSQGLVRPDMIHLLMESKEQIEEDDIAAQALLFFFAGFENISNVLSFMSHELAINPDVQDQLQKEIDNTMTKCNGHITYEAIHDMKYLDMIISETLRKWPPGLSLDRVCVKDYEIPAALPGERTLTIEKGTRLFIPQVSLHYDHKYFPEPEKFDPERFSEGNKDNIVPFSYSPFGSGPRNCIASRFALMEIKVLTFHFLAKFKFVATKNTAVPLKLSKKKWTMAPDEGFKLGVELRQCKRS